MTPSPQPGPGRRRTASFFGGRQQRPTGRRRAAPRTRRRVLVVGMTVAMLACAGYSVGRTSMTPLLADRKSATEGGTESATGSATESAAGMLDAALTRPFSIGLAAEARLAKGSVLTPTAPLPRLVSRAQALATRAERLLRARVEVSVGYFNMLGCYHTDRDEPNFGNLAYNFASCSSRMPRQFDWLSENGVGIVGIGEFQGKAWRVLSSYNSGHRSWGIYPRGQSGPYGQNPVAWRNSDWELVSGEQVRIPYNCGGGGSCRASSTLVQLEHRVSGRRVYVLNTHHTSDGGGGGAGRRASARSIELSRIAAVRGNAPVIYMGDFNEVGGAIGHIGRSMTSAFGGGMGIDQIWGTDGVSFAGTRYDGSFRSMGLTDHSSGIALTTATVTAP